MTPNCSKVHVTSSRLTSGLTHGMHALGSLSGSSDGDGALSSDGVLARDDAALSSPPPTMSPRPPRPGGPPAPLPKLNTGRRDCGLATALALALDATKDMEVDVSALEDSDEPKPALPPAAAMPASEPPLLLPLRESTLKKPWPWSVWRRDGLLLASVSDSKAVGNKTPPKPDDRGSTDPPSGSASKRSASADKLSCELTRLRRRRDLDDDDGSRAAALGVGGTVALNASAADAQSSEQNRMP
jgi:hypothetical protein